jgi:tetratricopeptide (TPR) repeat protein
MPTEEQLLEIHRLAVLGRTAAIAQDVGTRLTGHWLGVSRFREVRALSLQTLSLGPHADTTVHLARAKHRLGEVQEALTLSLEALQLYEEAGDRSGLATTLSNIGTVDAGLGQLEQALASYQRAQPIMEAVGNRAGLVTTLSNIGAVYADLGQPEQALTYFQQALPIREAVSDRPGERVTCYNMAMMYRAQGQLVQAMEALRQVVALDEQMQHRNLESDAAILRQVEQEWQAHGP